jgi:hypothetical protein
MIRFNYSWEDWCWQRSIKEGDDLCDRAAEVAHWLLLAGFCLQIEHTEIISRALDAKYQPESFRLIDASPIKPYKEWFEFHWPRSDDLYERVMKITAAKYVNGRCRVPSEHFAEVEDFAEQNGFEFTPAAQQLIQQARQLWEAALIIQPAKRPSKSKPYNPLDSDVVQIPDHLRDA